MKLGRNAKRLKRGEIEDLIGTWAAKGDASFEQVMAAGTFCGDRAEALGLLREVQNCEGIDTGTRERIRSLLELVKDEETSGTVQ